MEFALNLVWLLSAVALVCAWLTQRRNPACRGWFPLAAVFALTLILFPVISVTDDLLTAHNPAETTSSVRRDNESAPAHPIFPAGASLPEPPFHPTVLWAVALRMAAVESIPAPSGAFAANRFSRPPPTV